MRKAAKLYSISYSDKELDIIYSFIMEHYEDLLNQDIYAFQEIRDQISPKLYKQLLNIYIDLKQKYL